MIKIDRKALVGAFDFVKTVIPLKPIILADTNVSIRAEGQSIILYACDGIQAAKAVIPLSEPLPPEETFSVGCDPKRFSKAIQKDNSPVIMLGKEGNNILIRDPEEAEDKFVTLATANMKRASIVEVWFPDTPINDLMVSREIFTEVLTFLEEFTPAGKDEGSKHDVVVLSKCLAHSTNGINLRGICVTKDLPFEKEVSVRKRYLSALSKSFSSVDSTHLHFQNNARSVSVSTPDKSRCMVMPMVRKEPPIIPKEYLSSLGDAIKWDSKDILRGLDRMSSSNYNAASVLTGVDLKLSGQGENSKLQILLEEGKASQSFPVSRQGDEEIERTLDVTTLTLMLKTFSKHKDLKVFFGVETSKFLRFSSVRQIDNSSCAFIGVCAYARKT